MFFPNTIKEINYAIVREVCKLFLAIRFTTAEKQKYVSVENRDNCYITQQLLSLQGQ